MPHAAQAGPQQRSFVPVIPNLPTLRHAEQPRERNRSDNKQEAQNPDPLVEPISNLETAYDACYNTITSTRRLRSSPAGQQWVGIIDRRLEWLEKDIDDSRARVVDGLNRAMMLGAIGMSMHELSHRVSPAIDTVLPVVLDIRTFTQRLRYEEDRLRRTRADLLQFVADRPALLSAKLADGTTYEEKITSRLRQAYEHCRDAISKYERNINDAIEQEELRRRRDAERRLEDGRRGARPARARARRLA